MGGYVVITAREALCSCSVTAVTNRVKRFRFAAINRVYARSACDVSAMSFRRDAAVGAVKRRGLGPDHLQRG